MDKSKVIKICLFSLLLFVLVGCSTSAIVNEEVRDVLFTNVSSDELVLRAKQGDIDAQYALGYRYEFGNGVHANALSAVSWYKIAAENGHLQALFRLGIIQGDIARLLKKKGDSQKAGLLYVDSFQTLKKAANRGHPKAQHSVGFIYLNGIGVEENWKKAEEWFLLAAEQGDPLAEESLGRAYYLNGDAPNVDFEIAAKYFKRAAKKSMRLSQFFLAKMYEAGDAVPKDPSKAFKFMLLSAENGFDGAQNDVAIMYTNGEGTPVNELEGVKWLTKSAAQNNTEAHANLGRRYLLGIGVEKNIDKAKKLLLKAAERGHPAAANNLGAIYANQGHSLVDQVLFYSRQNNNKEAFKWFHLAASMQFETSYISVIRYCEKINCSTSKLSNIISFIRASAKKGSHKSLRVLGYMYEVGVGVKKDVVQSALNYYKAAQAGNRGSLDKLVSIYSSNNNLSVEDNALLTLFQHYANKKAPSAYCGLGLVYAHKYHSRQAEDKISNDDHENAYVWMRRCVKSGYRIYQDELYRLEEKLRSNQIIQLRARAL